jgi:hypothetical protein
MSADRVAGVCAGPSMSLFRRSGGLRTRRLHSGSTLARPQGLWSALRRLKSPKERIARDADLYPGFV